MTDREKTRMRVVLATDDSESARTAELWVTRLRFAQRPLIEVVCVAGRGITRLGWGMQSYREPVRKAIEGIRQSELLAAERIANEVGERLQESGLTVHAWARQGECGEELLTMIAADRPDLVVLGPRGRSGLAAAILGSVTQTVVTQADVPVLVARRPRATEGRLPDHVLLIDDGTLTAKAVISWLLQAGWLDGARVTVLGLLGDRPGLDLDEPALVDTVAGMLRSDATAALEELTRPLAELPNISLDVALRQGHPLQATLDAADELGADLIAAAGPLRSPRREPLAEKVARHAPVSVLLVPAG